MNNKKQTLGRRKFKIAEKQLLAEKGLGKGQWQKRQEFINKVQQMNMEQVKMNLSYHQPQNRYKFHNAALNQRKFELEVSEMSLEQVNSLLNKAEGYERYYLNKRFQELTKAED